MQRFNTFSVTRLPRSSYDYDTHGADRLRYAWRRSITIRMETMPPVVILGLVAVTLDLVTLDVVTLDL